jgi:purine-binding chemotaxis protein CheW
MMLTRQVCTFEIDGGFFGIEVQRVQEVLRHQEMTRVTLAQRIIRGLINLRGQIVMAIDLRRALDLADLGGDHSMNLVVRAHEGPVSFLVDKIMDVVDVDESTFELPPPNLHPPTKRIVKGSYGCVGNVLLLIDVDAVLALLDSPTGL